MKKVLLYAWLLTLATSSTAGYSTGYRVTAVKGKGILRNAFLKGQTAVHAGVGFFSLQYPSHDDYLVYGKVSSEYQMPINVRVDYGVTDQISAGIFVNKFGASTSIRDRTNDYNVNGWNYKSWTFGVNGAYHAYMGKSMLWFDPYVQGMVGMHALGSTPFGDANYLDPQKGGFAFDIQVGANIYFFQPLGFYVEAGYGVNIVNTGLTLRF
ncbi:MAG: hypothetical protein IT233_07960 [Bacteroidia bacterium]|nr:hypothetical protein [Bacteroidia bacterium]